MKQKRSPLRSAESPAPVKASNGFGSVLLWSPVLVAFLLYAFSTLNHGFVLDDALVLTSNRHVMDGYGGITELLGTNYGNGHNSFNDGLYRPLSLVTFALEKEWFELNPSSSHFLQALLYAIAALALLRWLFVLFPEHRVYATWVALLFAVHPIHTEVVANLKSRDEILAFLFFSLAAYRFTRWLTEQRLTSLLLSALWMAGAVFSKESAVAFLAVFPMIAYVKRQPFGVVIKGIAIMLFPVGFFLLVRHSVLSAMGPVDEGVRSLLQNTLFDTHSFLERIATVASIQGLYILKLFLPWNLSHDYSYDAIPVIDMISVPGILWTLVNIALIGAGAYGVVKRKSWGFGVLFYYATISIVSNLFILIGAMAAERFLFSPSLGWSIATVMIIAELNIQQKLKTAVLAGICLVFAALTWSRIPDWESNHTLFTADVIKVPNSARAHYNAGTVINDAANTAGADRARYLAEGRQHLRTAIGIWPDYQDAYNNLGISFLGTGEFDSAYHWLGKLVQRYPDYMKGHYNLGMTCGSMGLHEESERHLRRYLTFEPTNTDALYQLVDELGYQSRFSEAITNAERLVSLEPTRGRGYHKMGMAYAISGDIEKALKNLELAVQKEPGSFDFHYSLGTVQAGSGQTEKAKSSFQHALRINPDYEPARTALMQLGS